LLPGTNADNVADKVAKGRVPSHAKEKNPSKKLTQAAVDSIREQFATGSQNISQLARSNGVSRTQIHRIISHKNW
jgi:DNA invertase Pin-like site-specific DNA recombinase